MEISSDVKKIENKVYLSLYEDGIYDLTWGFLMLALTLNPLLYKTILPKTIIFISELILAVIIIIAGKRFISLPRMGLFKFSLHQKVKSKRILYAGIGLNIVFIILIVLSQAGYITVQSDRYFFIPVLYSIFFVSVFTILAYVTSYFTLMIIGIAVGISIPLSELLYPVVGEPFDFMIPFGISACIVIITGLIKLTMFIRKYPK